ncbi:MAG: hypothetical protein V3U57_10475, partial [Robiginitomaculum sp.]
DKTPFTIKSIQVDGGSEFMAEFEQACEDVNIPLIVLPPSRPTYNGGVERGNRTFGRALQIGSTPCILRCSSIKRVIP